MAQILCVDDEPAIGVVVGHVLQVGAVLGVTESRVSQLRKQALGHLAPLLQS